MTSGTSPSLSHMLFQLNFETCLDESDVLEAGNWGPAMAERTPWESDIVVGYDGATGFNGLKFDRGLEGGETGLYYFTIDDVLSPADIDFTVKAGRNIVTGPISGPTAECCTEGEVLGHLYEDENGNGVLDPGETNMLQGTVNLFSGVDLVGSASTDPVTGVWSFTSLDPALSYEVDALEGSLAKAMRPTAPESGGAIALPPPPVCTSVDFLYMDDINAAIGDFIWWDEIPDGVQQDTEKGIFNVEVEITAGPSGVGRKAYTDKNGEYRFYLLEPGTYTVTVKAITAFLENITIPQNGGPTNGGLEPLKRSERPLGTKGTNFDQILDRSKTGTTPGGFLNLGFDFEFTVGGTLPVEFGSLDAVVEGRSVTLRWESLSERNNSGFTIEMAGTGEFAEQGFVVGAGTSIEPRSYAYTIDDVLPGIHKARIRQTNYDGTSSYSPVIEFEVGLPGKYLLTEAYPNPFNPSTALSLSVDTGQSVRVTLHDALGRLVRHVLNTDASQNAPLQIRVDASGLPTGMYLLRVTGETFVANRNLVLMR